MLLLKKKHLLLGLCLVFIKIIPAHAADSSRLPKDRGIVLEVWGDKPLLVRPLAENVSIHPNRTYTFTHIPSFFSGWSFLSHEHKNTSHVHCRVKQGDTLYCCLWNETSPDQLGLKMPPKIVGTLQGEGFQGERTWTIYKLAVQKGHVLSLPSPDRWGTILIAPEIKIDETTNLIRKEYDLLSKQLARRNPKDLAYRRQQERLLAQTFRREALIWERDRDPLDVVLRRTQALSDHLIHLASSPRLHSLAGELAILQSKCKTTPVSAIEDRLSLFEKVCALRRRIAFANPLLDFDQIIFLKHHKARFNHMVDQYYGFHANPGGGVFILDNPFGANPRVRNLLNDTPIWNGRLQGKRLENGSYISLELSYDGRHILFAWSEADPVVEKWTRYIGHNVLWTPQSTYHIFKANSDGTQLEQLTDGTWNDFDPVFLPNGRIAFISERRGGYLRCGFRPNPTYTLHSMRDDGSDIITLSYHETHEWHPSVDHNGMIVYTRWDYVDRDSDIAHHLWLTYPDGRDPRSYHGNYPIMRESRPWMEMSIRAVPNSHRYAAVAAPHHGQAYGSLVLIDQQREDDRAMSQIKRLTPDVCFPESESEPARPHYNKGEIKNAEAFGTPWPLSEDFYVGVYDADCRNYGIYLIDSFGNRELLYRDPRIPCLDPIPLRPRRRPPLIPAMTTQASEQRRHSDNDTTATVLVINVYDSDFTWPPGTEIKALRIIQLYPKTTPPATIPNIGIGDQSLARGVLGTVPVEIDGSAYFEAPVGTPIYFQALDKRYLAVQTMRSDTYLHPGERLTCQGCHEAKRRISPANSSKVPLALQRPASKITPDPAGSRPLLFSKLVQPVLDRHCQDCHQSQKEAPSLSGTEFGPWGWSRSYHTLSRLAWAKHGGNGTGLRKNGTSYSIPGEVGARASRLFKLLEQGHHDVRLSADDLYRITVWLDGNSTFYGAYHEIAEQAQGQAVNPPLQ